MDVMDLLGSDVEELSRDDDLVSFMEDVLREAACTEDTPGDLEETSPRQIKRCCPEHDHQDLWVDDDGASSSTYSDSFSSTSSSSTSPSS